MLKVSEPLKLAVVGRGISYSKSPFIHTEFAKQLGLSVNYIRYDIAEQPELKELTDEAAFQKAIEYLRADGFYGCNITVPFKELAFRLANETSASAKQAGAGNTFVFKRDRIYLDNVDGRGLIRDITQNIHYNLQGRDILILGAGGAVRSILGSVLAQHPHSIAITNRTLEKALELQKIFPSVQALAYSELGGRRFDVVMDGTSLKLSDPWPLPDTVTLKKPSDALVYDLKYSAGKSSPVLIWGKKHHASQLHEGIGMLVEQAAEGFYIWTGKKPRTQPVLEALKISAKELIGFAGLVEIKGDINEPILGDFFDDLA